MKTAEEINNMTSEEFRSYLRNTEEGKKLLAQARKITSNNNQDNIKLLKEKIWEEILANLGYSRTVNRNKTENKEEIIENFRDFLETRKGQQISRKMTQKFWQMRKEERQNKNK